MTDLFAPLQSLKQGDWFKLICGASFQHLPAVRSLTLAYTLAGADCIDVAADPAVIAAAQAGLLVAKSLATDAQKRGFSYKGNSPFLMVSLNDGEDPHFRKAEFNPTECPTDCPRPCERICPAQAIVFNNVKENFSGVISEKCYGCGRCIPVCPYSIIDTSSYMSTPQALAPLVMSTGVDAVEIHTKVGRLTEFEQLWQAISPWADQLKLLAISCPDGEGMIDYLRAVYDLIAPLKSALIWQTDGRPMSGDIGDGTTIAAVKLGQKVLAAKLPGYVQLAGGTNSYTVAKLKAMEMLKRAGGAGGATTSSSPSSSPSISGVAYGSYARVLLSPILEQLENKEVNNTNVQANLRLEENDVLLWQAVKVAHSLVSQIKSQQEH
ncbi:MinD superfamily P-loop ATPase, containings an inserted ferredoxin domain [Nostoc flagelliforme CCNUN1]|uniref:MinD superfamily P-loop ATPase, containings an inserted ferredoxin domain n=1 Tax=Nostoc flagelliforme CCNUN1 TaxID=2038116 RepID=A0A2K8T6P9_9NOSO|nr:LdpA C-terminal domain-containing domain [Nostoc flagelliforme]AUB42735.1 MinD superfamily P-loop ATPase, containings an inserted ferredoxin domain [Nostoc flagelliforme CCNUN1]